MAAAGMGNRDIAQALFVTRKTIEAQLGATYRKLDIHSRNELAGLLEQSAT
jgi:DNA-binding NarL/FixJ family response regulator